eukprot:365325-Chlamydomonas_euryale.AAC.13
MHPCSLQARDRQSTLVGAPPAPPLATNSINFDPLTNLQSRSDLPDSNTFPLNISFWWRTNTPVLASNDACRDWTSASPGSETSTLAAPCFTETDMASAITAASKQTACGDWPGRWTRPLARPRCMSFGFQR